MPNKKPTTETKAQENESPTTVEGILIRSGLYGGLSAGATALGYSIRYSLHQTETGLVNAAFNAGVGGLTIAVPVMASLYFLSNGREFSLAAALAIITTAGATGAALLGGDVNDALENGVYGTLASVTGVVLGFDSIS